MLKIENLTYSYPGQTTPYRFNLSLNPGETIAISGKSGSGKSTLLDLIAGFHRPSTGTLRWTNTDLLPLAPEARPVSILFQTDNLFDHLTVGTNLDLGISRNLSDPQKTALIDKALTDVGLANLRTRRAAALSGGEKQRVALARTLLRERPILLLDEPFSALDPATAIAMRVLIKSLITAHNWAAIIVSHDPEDAKTMGTRHLKMKEGGLEPASETV